MWKYYMTIFDAFFSIFNFFYILNSIFSYVIFLFLFNSILFYSISFYFILFFHFSFISGIYRCPVYKILTRTGILSTTGTYQSWNSIITITKIYYSFLFIYFSKSSKTLLHNIQKYIFLFFYCHINNQETFHFFLFFSFFLFTLFSSFFLLFWTFFSFLFLFFFIFSTGHSTNFVAWIEIPSREKTIFRSSLVSETNAQIKYCDQDYWIKAGVACFCALRY